MSTPDRDDDTKMSEGRRTLLRNALFGAGMWGLRSLATGIPVSILMNPRKALAQGCTPVQKAQYLIFSTSGNGDPLNGNVPGTYADANVVHPQNTAATLPGGDMTPTSMTVGGKQYMAAAPWATLDTSHACFFHHGTYTVVHPDERKVLELMGAAYGGEMLVSLLSQQLAPKLCTIQSEPVAVAAAGASETIFYQGRPQPMLRPTALATVLTAPSSPITVANIQKQRDQDLDRLNAFFKGAGNKAQQDFIDRYANSQVQARAIAPNLLSQLAGLSDNTPDSQIAAALVLFQMNVTPVVTIHLPWGGDNHTDPSLTQESLDHNSSVASINTMMSSIAGIPALAGKVSFMAMNVFGRTMNVNHKGYEGRDHHGDHHCTVLIGSGFKSSVIGGIEAANNDFRAQSIDSNSGNGVASGGGDVAFADTMGSMAKTVGMALGVDQTFLDANISQGKVIQPALT